MQERYQAAGIMKFYYKYIRSCSLLRTERLESRGCCAKEPCSGLDMKAVIGSSTEKLCAQKNEEWEKSRGNKGILLSFVRMGNETRNIDWFWRDFLRALHTWKT